MDIAAIISANLTSWMAETPALDTFKKLSAKSGVGFGTVQRAKNGDGNITVEKLDMIAAVFGRTAAELVTPHPAQALQPNTGKYAEHAPGKANHKTNDSVALDTYQDRIVEAHAKALAQQASEVAGLWMDLSAEHRNALLEQLRREAGAERAKDLTSTPAPQRRPGRPSKAPQDKPDYPASSG